MSYRMHMGQVARLRAMLGLQERNETTYPGCH